MAPRKSNRPKNLWVSFHISYGNLRQTLRLMRASKQTSVKKPRALVGSAKVGSKNLRAVLGLYKAIKSGWVMSRVVVRRPRRW